MALYKAYPKKGKTCKVTFELPAEATMGVKKVALVGDFNSWDTKAHVLSLNKEGLYSITVALEQGNEYQFRYLMDDIRWENDWAADKYMPSNFGNADNSVVIV
ncbi:isoamylase early set domain-containing protein [Treponema zuelzerae]|uniref:Isoamylase early set domain-containing protein n=1 Tax=Teretinema zuelzerae TaxID=156 RepID=A0AAE3JN01_9SPIR|nr:isoamylase early set domain-containing protein [Teretinema zuelzerae]MCD1656174.1 isoamylase early set domain-containing protein [Teretinema zuelzerae]HPO01727.1 isoamylase early set domain-containing protein [Treponemataceae bacterium]